ncbi:MAG: peptidoglycan DD-metalloendopeptidase family protein [Kofleriaceae bacterium]
MSTIPLLLGGGALAYLWSRGRSPSPVERTVQKPDPSESGSTAPSPPGSSLTLPVLPGRWVWPVAKLGDRQPLISDGVGSPRPGGPHRGVDIMFSRTKADRFQAGTPNASKMFVMPDNVAVLAAGDGTIWSAGPTSRGFAVVIDHGKPSGVATFYIHMEKLFVTPTSRAQTGQRVRAGDPIGIVGASPLDGEKLKHLHFEIWRGNHNAAIDPAPFLRAWPAVADPRETLVARNSGLVYRRVGETGERYPAWVHELKGQSGVYVIREVSARDDSEIVYVGQSSAGRLYETLTRHLQTWRRWKGFWRGQYGEGHDPGLTYDRDRVEVAVRTTSPNDALDEEARLIRRLKPRDNLIGQSTDQDVPF